MLTDMTPTAGQFYGSQIPTMGMNITNIANHMQKPALNNVSTNSKINKKMKILKARIVNFNTFCLFCYLFE